MKPYSPLIFAGALLLNTAPSWAQHSEHHLDQTQPGAATTASPSPAGSFSAAQATWKDVQEQTQELDSLIASRKLEGVHDAALSLRDTVRELRFGWSALPANQQAKADAGIRKIDGLLDALHETADHNDLKGTVRHQRTLHLLLDEIAGAFPAQTLKPIGPIVAKGAVKDPLCRMTVDPATAAAKVAYGGQTYYFCAASEAGQFQKNPTPYVALYDELTFGKPRQYTVSLSTGGQKIQAGREANLVFAVREQGKKAITTEFQPVHEKLFHLIAVSDDLSWFGHVHPEQAPDGRFYLRQSFPRDGRYFLYSDFTPAQGANTVARSEVRVGTGVTRQPQKLVADSTLSKVVDGVQVDLKLSAPLKAGQQALLTYSLSQNGQPVKNMTPYLAAMGHMMAISQNGRDVVHTHTVSAGSDPVTGLSVTPEMSTAQGPTQTFKLELPSGGLYKIWAQFGINGRIVTVPFTFHVQENPTMKLTNSNLTKPAAALAVAATMGTTSMGALAHDHTGSAHHQGHTASGKSAKPAATPKNAQKITVTLPQGYKNGTATVKAGRPVALTFYLKEDAGCGNSISVPAAKWNKTLKVGQKATVVYTPKKSGPLAFQCSMGHMKGTLTVK